ncbi:polysaccharide biosynthesis tyrosine autokinase, partial [Acidobacteria bacterium AH-259-A15]|nr:polysaccharide biosynthesis tyrosine autokinase [Acidobacteria bacterium AH-259-A15]
MAEFEFDLRDIFRLIRRWKWIITLSPILVGTLTYWSARTPPAVYKAESVVKIARVATNMQALLIEALSYYEGDNIATQLRIITSQKIRAAVALRLAQKYPEFHDVSSLLGDAEEWDYDALEQRVGNNPKLAALINSISVEAERDGKSDLLGIAATASSAGLAIDMANYTAEEFVDYNIAERNKEIRRAVQFIQARILETEQQLSEVERRLEEFKRDHTPILGLEIEEGVNVEEQIESLGRKITNLDKAIGQLEATAHVDQYLAFSPAFKAIEDPLISPLEQEVLQLIVQINQSKREGRELLSYLTEASGEVRQNVLHTKELEESAEEIIGSLLEPYRAIRDEWVEEHRGLLQRQNRLEAVPEVTRQLASLEREVALKTDTLNLLQRRLQDAEIQSASEVQEISIVERASSAGVLPRPSRRNKTLVGLIIGIVIGVFFALLMESLDTSIGTIEDVERYVKLPVLGVIPHLDIAEVREKMLVDEMGSDIAGSEIEHIATLCTHFASTETSSEAFRSMRAHLEVLLKRSGWKTLMVTSSVVEEGKTSTACNLAVVFAQSGQRTLLIDADLRRPRVHKVFGLPDTPGLTEVLLGVTDWESATRSIDDLILGKIGLTNAQITPGLEYLSLLTSGRKVDQPAELLNLEKVSKVLSEMSECHDIIIVDVAPVLPIADASQLAPRMDATVLAYQIGRVGREVVNRSKSRLKAIGGNVVGLVMNDIQAEIYYHATSDYEYYNYEYKQNVPSKRLPGPLNRWKERLSDILSRPGLGQTSATTPHKAPVTSKASLTSPPMEAPSLADKWTPEIPSRETTLCMTCGTVFTPMRSHGRFCSNRCRQKAYRMRRRPT